MISSPSPRLAFAAASAAVLLNWSLAAGTGSAGSGLSVTPAVIERTAVRGDTATVTVANGTSQKLKVSVTPRPWTQSRTSGAVAPNRHKTLLSRLKVSARSFTLAPGARRAISINIKSIPSAGSLYGSVETIGVPVGAPKKNGITAAYRLIGTLRLNPPAAKRHLAVHASALHRKGTTIVLPVKNTGNTVSPISGDIRIKGAAGTSTGTIRSTAILPGATVNLGLGSTRGLPKGTYKVTIALTQGGRKVLRTTRTLRVR
jgi:hypothetical protein